MTESVVTKVHWSIEQSISDLPQWKDKVRVVSLDADDHFPMAAVVLVYAKDGNWKKLFYQVLLLTDTHSHVLDGQVVSRSTLVTKTYDSL